MTQKNNGNTVIAENTHNVSDIQKQQHTEYITFVAIKLIEGLYKEGKIDACVFNKILKENERKIDTSQFVMAG